MGEVDQPAWMGSHDIPRITLLSRIEQIVDREGQRQGLSPGGRDEAYGRVLRALLRRAGAEVFSEDSDRSHVVHLVRLRTRELVRRLKWNGTCPVDPAVLDTIPAPESGNGPDAEVKATLRSALLRLAPEDTRILVMVFWCECGFSEIAKSLGFPHHEPVRRRLRRALGALCVALRAGPTASAESPDPGLDSIIERADCARVCPRRPCPWT